MEDNHYDEFFNNRADMEAEFIEFGNEFLIPVEKNLRSIKDRSEFLAEIIEYRFGIFFGKLSYQLEHEKKVFPGLLFTPDWTLRKNSQTIVAEVIRLNPSQSDATELDFADSLMDTIGAISGDFLVQLEYDYAKVIHNRFDQLEFKHFVSNWLASDPPVGHSLLSDYNIAVRIEQANIGLKEVCVLGPFKTIEFDYRRLAGDKSRLFSKLKYAKAIDEHNLPYFICIHLSFESWFKPSDIFQRLFGSSGIFHGDFPFKEYYPNAQFHNFADGLYYSNELFKKNVSGILVYYQEEFIFFPNYFCQNKLNKDTMESLNTFIYKELIV